MVFACLMLSVFATIDDYEQKASVVLFYMVSIGIAVLVFCPCVFYSREYLMPHTKETYLELRISS